MWSTAATASPTVPALPAPAPEALFTEALIDAIAQRLAAFAPERGGALLGQGGVADLLLEDDFGDYGPAHWDISAELSDAVGAMELADHGQLIGTVHTHPAGVWDPSWQDRSTMTQAMEMNPHLDQLFVCVVTHGHPRPTDAAIPGGHRMSVHLIRRTDGGGLEFVRARAVVVPTDHAPGLHTDASASARDVVANGVEAYVVAPGMALPHLVEVGIESATARVAELTGRMDERRVLIAGAGSVGSRIAEDLVRSGVRHFVLVDHDVVSLPNLARSTYVRADVGAPKVDVLAVRLRAINPEAHVVAVRAPLADADLHELLDGVDLVVMATDDMAQQAELAASAYRRGIMQVSGALYRKAAAGEAVFVVPEAGTPCWGCIVGTAAISASERPDTNYGVDGRLVAESGLGPSINLVASTVSLLAIGLLAGPDSAAGQPLGRLVAQSRTFVLIGTTPNWGLFADIFDSMAHQSHPQSVWPRVTKVAGCPVCAPEAPDDVLTGVEVTLADLVKAAQ